MGRIIALALGAVLAAGPASAQLGGQTGIGASPGMAGPQSGMAEGNTTGGGGVGGQQQGGGMTGDATALGGGTTTPRMATDPAAPGLAPGPATSPADTSPAGGSAVGGSGVPGTATTPR